MVKWKYVATQLAEYSRVPLGGHYTDEFLARTWVSLFDYPSGTYHDPNLMRGDLAILYDFFMTIAQRQGLTDSEKVKRILQLLKSINGNYSSEAIQEILGEAGYKEKITHGISRGELGHIMNFHPAILDHCASLFKRGEYSICINEACKAYNQAVKKMSSSEKDGRQLMLWAFSDKGNLRINPYKSTSEKDKQDGIMFLSAGLMAGFRNPTAHETAKDWKITKEECIEVLALASLLFKVLDGTTRL
ncbi:MAG TPA: TIGR02391 family protein [Puia sp.]|uniref:TIGR02391 family protein n=1 Tax=Puia sp. TaxID=2045100 RepID=UPI002BEDA033|nr:TIGR02391 family protein [Puia sp.]HVU97321.1 TIGR02391 family protein [Puia sp.]